MLTLTSAGGIATLAQWQAALDAVTYTDTAITPNNATRTISFTANDGVNTSNTATRTVTVADVDQTPIVTTTGGTTNYVGGTSATAVDGGVTVSDRDNTTQSTGTVSITTGFHSGDTLSFTNTSSLLFGNIVASYNAGTGVLTLSSSGATAQDAQWANAFDAVTFSAGVSATPGNRTVSFIVNDGIENSTAATKTVDVLGPPTVTTDSGSASFTAGDNVTSTPVTIDSGLTVTDGSSSTLASATIAITGNFHSGEDVLAFTNNGSTMGNIAGAYNATTGVLTLTSAGGIATLAQWQAALDAVTYTDTAITPNNATRTISFTANDGVNTSNTATRTVTVADVDQTPIVTTTGGTTNYTAGASATTVDGGVTVSDLDNTTQASGTVTIGSGFHSGDTLAFTNTSLTLFGNITASYNAGTGVLTLSSSGATATDAQWANAFDAVTFSAGTSATVGNRTISFVVNDGTENSAAATKTVDVLGPPTVTTDSGSAAFTAGDNVASTPVTIDSGLTVTDGSSSTLASATIAITGNFHSGQDVLAFTNDGSTMGNIAGAYNATTGVLTLTSSGASATLAQWQAALDAVTYTDTAITPNNATRTISFTTNDGVNTSNTATRTVTVADVDQTPIVTTTSGTTTYEAGASGTTVDGGVTVSDRDNATLASATVTIGSGFQSGDTLSFSNTNSTLFGNISASYNAGTGVLTLTSADALATDAQWANAFDAVTFSAGTSATVGNRTISFVVNDGIENSTAATKTVEVVGPPTVTTDSGSAAFTAGDNVTSTPVTIDSGLAVADPTSTTLSTATVAITGNFHSGEDVLSFTNDGATMGNIASSYNATTGVLTLTSSGSSATLAQWRAALDAILYTDTAITPTNTTRTISFTVNDGTASSALATRTVTVADTDQTPIVTTSSSTTSFTGNVNGTAVPVAIDSGIAVSDRDNTTLASATVSITDGYKSGEDLLAFKNDGATMGNISGSFNAATGVLTLTSSGNSATLAQWQAALAAVTYVDDSTNATGGTRTVAFTINDGTKNSVAATHMVAVNPGEAPAETLIVQVTDDMPPPPDTPTVADGAHSAPLIVLVELDNASEPGAIPTNVHTATFSGDAHQGNRGSVGETSVTAPIETPSESTHAPIDIPVVIDHRNALLGQPFALALQTAPTGRGDEGTGGLVTIAVRQADGRPLPAWVHYDPATGVLSGTAPADGPRELHMVVVLRDTSGHVTRRDVVLDFRGSRNVHAAGHHDVPHAARAAAKPSLADQFVRQRRAFHVAQASRTA
ncbi:hypothetical protein D7S89_12190 [Trinickia fusca]|uniref:Dystroglycan-type cadherin-like domain-containing protein n=1 Tax=Trinickia fusca TaxID=2419777 RepID=A0A494XEM6_9BURK|nr:hypothetical protein D7S89_12190 [Trinickia fusca]